MNIQCQRKGVAVIALSSYIFRPVAQIVNSCLFLSRLSVNYQLGYKAFGLQSSTLLKKSTFSASMKNSEESPNTSNSKGTSKKKNVDVPHSDPLGVFESLDEIKASGKKRPTIESIYQKKSQLEHILIRPDTYIGSIEPHTENMWVFDEEQQKMVMRELTYVPGLYKIYDEIVVNAADNKQRDPSMNCIKISINATKNEIMVWNNGKGIPVVEHKEEKMYVPEMIFGTLLTSSNYDDTERKVTGGRNGYGAKLCNIFSKRFVVETSCREYKKHFKQVWTKNMTATEKPVISDCVDQDFTCVRFIPDLDKFGMEKLDDDIVALMCRRAYDIAGSTKGVKVFLNGKRIPVLGFKEYVDLYLKDRTTDTGEPLKVVYEQPHPRWEVAVAVSDRGFQQVSFTNSIATTKGGRHVDYVCDGIVEKVIENVKKQTKKTGMNVRPFQVKNHLWLFINCLIENPTFDSQTKENMTLQPKSFGSKCTLSDKFFSQVLKCGVLESVLSWLQYKAQAQLDKKCHSTKHSKLKGVPKLEDANEAGTKNSHRCTLILTEGDSAKSLAVAGFSVVGRDFYGVFPLKGKVLNVREANYKQIMENAEINNLIKIIGLQYKCKYDTSEQMNSLRYGRVMIMADQDQDGSHIKGLVINFFHHNWPNLLRRNFIEEFITPIVKATKGREELQFFSIPQYFQWRAETANWKAWKVKYYKGLGTSTAKEAKEYFTNMDRHRIVFKYEGPTDDDAIELAFSKKRVEDRKNWLGDWMLHKKQIQEANLPEEYLYQEDTKEISYKSFIDKELILFSNMDNERSIPSMVDGLKPGQRKVLFTCFKRNDKREVKVAQLAGSVAEHSAYHHGEVSLMSTIINLAHNFVGSNNINILLPIGQFGTRLLGGRDAASARYIFTMLSPVTRAMFCTDDEPNLNFLFEDNQKIEPFWYCPILPLVLVNGCEGIGTGWSTKVPNHDPRIVVKNLKRLMNDEELLPMYPWYKNFQGEISTLNASRFVCFGEIASVDDTTLEITELPIGTWTQNYKESVLEPMLYGADGKQPVIQDFKEYHTDTTVRFIIRMSKEKMAEANAHGIHKYFKLQTIINSSSMVLFDEHGCLKKFETAKDILISFYKVRLDMYVKRKAYLEGHLEAQANRLKAQARFIMEKIEGVIKIENMKKKHIVEQLVERGYPADPVKKWKEAENMRKLKAMEEFVDETDEANEVEETGANEEDVCLSDYDYLLSMALIRLSEEEKDKLLKDRDVKIDELNSLKAKTPKMLWIEDLDKFLDVLDKHELSEKEEAASAVKGIVTSGKGNKASSRNARKKVSTITAMPESEGIRIPPQITSDLREKAEKADQVKQRMINLRITGPRTVAGAKVVAKKTKEKELENGQNEDQEPAEDASRPTRKIQKKLQFYNFQPFDSDASADDDDDGDDFDDDYKVSDDSGDSVVNERKLQLTGKKKAKKDQETKAGPSKPRKKSASPKNKAVQKGETSKKLKKKAVKEKASPGLKRKKRRVVIDDSDDTDDYSSD
ncbi:putative DNA topoisomerase 2 [Trichinella spiralis]|uniref:DNA topoisomerase 2 n=1 Tax=Trichinella spiralis TaxID=6334 RepID=A0A0V1BI13_TRISP|nr:putative DNA topoisomerase 2 [Trichinella spiralis]